MRYSTPPPEPAGKTMQPSNTAPGVDPQSRCCLHVRMEEGQAAPRASRQDAVDERGTLTVTWRSRAAPWVAYRVRVDGVEVARVRYRKPAAVALPAGRHDVQLCGPRGRYTSRSVQVDVLGSDRIDLFGSTRRLPAGMWGYREISQWAREHSIWLGAEGEVPPASDYVRTFNALRLGLHISAFGLFALFAATAAWHHRWLGLALALALIAATVATTRVELARRRHPT